MRRSYLLLIVFSSFFTKVNSQINYPNEIKLENIKWDYELLVYIDVLDRITGIKLSKEIDKKYHNKKMILNLYENEVENCLNILKTKDEKDLYELKLYFEKFKEIERFKQTKLETGSLQKAPSADKNVWLDIRMKLLDYRLRMYVLGHYSLIKAYNIYTNTKIIDPEKYNSDNNLIFVQDISLENFKNDKDLPPPPPPPPPSPKKKN